MGSAELKKDQIENGTLLRKISQISKRISFSGNEWLTPFLEIMISPFSDMDQRHNLI